MIFSRAEVIEEADGLLNLESDTRRTVRDSFGAALELDASVSETLARFSRFLLDTEAMKNST